MLADVTDFRLERLSVPGASYGPSKQGQFTLVDRIEPQQHFDEGGLAGTVGAKKTKNLSAFQTHVDMVVGHEVAETLGQSLRLHDDGRYLRFTLSGTHFDGGQGFAFFQRIDEKERFERRLLVGRFERFQRIGEVAGMDAVLPRTLDGFIGEGPDRVDEFAVGPLGDDFPLVEQKDSVHFGGFLHIGGADKCDRPFALADIVENLPQLQTAQRVDAGGRFVQNQQFRPMQQCTDKRKFLHHAAAQFSGGTVDKRPKSRHVKKPLPVTLESVVFPDVSDGGEEVEMFGDRQVFIKDQSDSLRHQPDFRLDAFRLLRRVVGDILVPYFAIEMPHPRDRVHQRTLSSPIRADETEYLPSFSGQVGIFDRRDTLVPDGDAVDFKNGHFSYPFSLSPPPQRPRRGLHPTRPGHP